MAGGFEFWPYMFERKAFCGNLKAKFPEISFRKPLINKSLTIVFRLGVALSKNPLVLLQPQTY